MIKTCFFSLFFIIPSFTLASHCPTDLMQNHSGHWVSHDAPGWQSVNSTPHGVSINTKDFGGAHFSPQQQRMVCLFRRSDSGWLALVSHKSKHLQIDRHSTADNHKNLAWIEDPVHKDFSCGKPYVHSRLGCKFEIVY